MTSVLIVGGGLAAARCAEALRAYGFDGPLVVAGAEHHAPYERPALSKEFLSGSRDAASLALREDGAWAAADIRLHLGSAVTRIDLDHRRALTRCGRTHGYDVLVIATGSRPRRHPLVSDIPGVHHLRTLDDADRLREGFAPGSRLAIVGAGLIGAEVASTALGHGITPTLIETARAPLGRAFGCEIGALLAERWRVAGADVRTDARVCGVRLGRRGATSLRFDDGTSLECDQILVAIGAVPVTSLVAYQLSLAADGGIATDACGRTSVPGVFACGDVASWHRQGIDGRRASGELVERRASGRGRGAHHPGRAGARERRSAVRVVGSVRPSAPARADRRALAARRDRARSRRLRGPLSRSRGARGGWAHGQSTASGRQTPSRARRPTGSGVGCGR